MKGRRVIAAAALALLLTACGESPGSDTAQTPAAPTTPDAVAAAFAAAFAGGDTPSACTYTGGLAGQNMSQGGTASLCARSAWPAQDYWLARQCMTPAVDVPGTVSLPAGYWYVYATNGQIAGSGGFVIDVTGADRAWQVTSYTSGPAGQLARICAVLESGQPTTGPTS